MFSIKESFKYLFVSGILIIFLLNCSSREIKKNDRAPDLQALIIQKADDYLKNKKFNDAEGLLKNYIKKFPDSYYSDDAVYRLAYMKVIADQANPYYDYIAAIEEFNKFRKRFSKSDYLSACNNWLKILNLYQHALKQQTKQKPVKNTDLMVFKKEIEKLKKENRQLKKTLLELEKALER